MVPSDPAVFDEWIQAGAHLAFLQSNALAEEMVIYASCEFSFVQAVAVPNSQLFPLNRDDLLQWSFTPPASIASYVTGGGREDVWVERGHGATGSEALDGATPLLFRRTFEGWTGRGATYFELHQEYAHLTEIHWRPEERAFCKYDDRGDLSAIVSVTSREKPEDRISLVTFQWRPLEEYLAASELSLVRLYDFTLLSREKFTGWPSDLDVETGGDDQLFYRRRVVPGYAAFTRGVQIVRPRRPPKSIFKGITDSWFGKRPTEFVEFEAWDWRNQRITTISTDPQATTNYFEAESNDLPFELSPAFFRPEVLLKYKGDRGKYTVTERDVSCRASWRLEAIDVNEAGQDHAYICYLRRLPYTEQLHWLSYNESPKANISERAVLNDFEGRWVKVPDPVGALIGIARRWRDDAVWWWTLRDGRLLERISTPVTASRDEWAEAVMDLSKLIVEGFNVKAIRTSLEAQGMEYGEHDGSIALLERLVKGNGSDAPLTGLREAQRIRSKVKGHVVGTEGEALVEEALRAHETFAFHFRHLCGAVNDDLAAVEAAFGPESGP